jgi:hypothetical protein
MYWVPTSLELKLPSTFPNFMRFIEKKIF